MKNSLLKSIKDFYYKQYQLINLLLICLLLLMSCDKDALRHLENASKFYARGMYSQAIIEMKSCSRLLKDNVSFQQSYYKDILFAVISLKEGNHQQAIDNFCKALQKRPDQLQLRFLVSTLYVQEKKFSQAINIFQEKEDPITHYYVIALESYYQKNFQKAIDNFNKVIHIIDNELIVFQRDSKDQVFTISIIKNAILKMIGKSYYDLKKYPEAIVAFTKVLAEEQDFFIENYLNIAKLQVQLQKNDTKDHLLLAAIGYQFNKMEIYNEAIHYYLRALKYQDDYFPAILGLAKAYNTKGDWQKAETYYQKAIDMASKNKGNVYLDYADMLLNQGNYQKAVQYFEEALKLMPDSEVANNELQHSRLLLLTKNSKKMTANQNYSLAKSYKNRKDYLSALKYINYALRNEKDNKYLLLLADIYLHLEKYTNAEDVFHKLLRKENIDLQVYSGLASSLLIKQNYQAAISFLEIALKNNPDNLILRHQLAQIYFEAGINSKAVKNWQYVKKHLKDEEKIDFINKMLEIIN